MTPRRNILFITLLFTLFFVSIVGATFTVSSTGFDFGGSTAEPTDFEQETLTLTNNYVEARIEGFSHSFTQSSNVPHNTVSIGSFVMDFTGIVIPSGGTSSSINVDFTIPEGLDAIDDEFADAEWDVGDLVITGNLINTTTEEDHGPVEVTIPITTQIENHLEIADVELTFGDDDPFNVSNGGSENPRLDQEITITVRYENTYDDDDYTFDGDDIEIKLFFGSDDLETLTGEDNVEKDEIGMASTQFELEDFDAEVDEKYDVLIEMRGINNEGGVHGATYEFELDIQEEEDTTTQTSIVDLDQDGVDDEIDFCPDTLLFCEVDEAGCALDNDNDGICNTSDSTPDGEEDEEDDEPEQQEEEPEEPEEDTTQTTPDEPTNSSSMGSFVFGLVIGIIGTALFFVMTRN